ncbi:MAG: endolytic transglycosylase MltG, partial [Betaproteobacteria bacterium]|nr:endolytic transglycosylase MltG [Betaproteobacteria bacterium]
MVLAILAACLAWLQLPMGFKPQIVSSSPSPQVLDLSIEMGTSPKGVAQAIADAGADVSPPLLVLWFRLSGQDRAIKAGSYEITPEMSPRMVLNMLARGEESLRYVTLVEGWTFKQVKQALAKAETLKASTQGMSDAQIMAQLGRPNVHPEGRFYPDTYSYSKGSSDLAVMNRALKAMDRQLAKAWSQKPANLPLVSPDEVLTLASIVEKETGRASDRPFISSVFHNRLKIGMRLQTDPTVIYGLGDAFDGNLRRVDLRTDTPYNTYTRAGLPPTPIAMPGKAALKAAMEPAPSNFLYFVAKGDGSSHFSQSLNEHNNAVNKYQRGISKQEP